MNNDCVSATAGAEPIEGAVLAMAYVPFQKFGMLYDEVKALDNGTLYPDLDKPFKGRSVMNDR